VEGVTGGKSAHLTGGDENKVTSMDDITVDIGALSRKEAEDLGVRIGDYLHYNRIGKFLNSTKIYSGKSVTDLVAQYVVRHLEGLLRKTQTLTYI